MATIQEWNSGWRMVDNHNTCAASTPHVALHCSLIWLLHIPLLKLDPLSKMDNHQRTRVIQFDCQNWLHWKINQSTVSHFLAEKGKNCGLNWK